AASQSWSTGEVVMAGPSYLGISQLLAATARPPALKAIAPTLSWSELYEGSYSGGAFRLAQVLMWAWNMAARQNARQPTASGANRTAPVVNPIMADPWAHFTRLPLSDLPRSVSGLEEYAARLAHPERDQFWTETAIRTSYSSIAVPALHVAGWFDVFL